MHKHPVYHDPETKEIYVGYSARKLAKELLLTCWQKVRVPALLLLTLAGFAVLTFQVFGV